MPEFLSTPLGHIAIVEIKRGRARKSEFILAHGRFTTHTESIRLVRTLGTFNQYKPFSLQVRDTEFGNDPPLAVYYHIVPPGSLRLSKINSVYWETLKESFFSNFPGRVNALRAQNSSAMLSNLEQSGKLVRLANDVANGGNWGVVIFGVGRGTETSDPFDVVKEQVPD